MSLSPYTDSILDFLSDQKPHTLREIREGIMAPDGAGLAQLIRGLMWTLAVEQDDRKLVAIRGKHLTYQIVARDPRNPVEIPEY